MDAAIQSWFLEHEIAIRLSAFAGIFLLMTCYEFYRPCRRLVASKSLRWLNNISLVTLNSIVLRILFPTAAAGIAVWSQHHQIGLFNQFNLSWLIIVPVSVLMLDLLIYWQHRIFHHLPWLWRVHRVHHADLDIDVTTGARFHPIEIIISMLIKFVAIMLLGIPVVAVIVFEVILNGMAMFNHANVKLPVGLERVLRFFIVTPEMHRIHHSIVASETHSNFGFNLSIWDRMFSSYTAQSSQSDNDMVVGLPEANKPIEVVWITGLLQMPFKSNKTER